MAPAIRLGVALEFGVEQYADTHPDHVGFWEYGLHLSRGLPEWVSRTQQASGAGLVIHPLDVNLSSTAAGEEQWIAALARLVRQSGATALVSDMGFWYHHHRSSMWPRPPHMSTVPRECCRRAAEIAQACGVPFRVENPPLEWMPGRPAFWRYLEQASDAEGVEICLDLSHLCQFQFNVYGEMPVLPRDFPWQRVSELHLAGYIVVEYAGLQRYFDQHLAEIGDEQFALVRQVLERRSGEGNLLDICLEMEPRSPVEYSAAAQRLLGGLGSA